MPRKFGHHPSVKRNDETDSQKGTGEKPLKIVHTSPDAHFIPQRAQDVIAGEQKEKVSE